MVRIDQIRGRKIDDKLPLFRGRWTTQLVSKPRLKLKQKPSLADRYNKLAGAWNKRLGLRFGDRAVAEDPHKSRRRSGHLKTVDARKWDFSFCCRHVFSRVGVAEVPRQGLGQTRRNVEMIIAMCCLGILAQRAAVRDQFKVGIEQHVGQLCPPGSGTAVEAYTKRKSQQTK